MQTVAHRFWILAIALMLTACGGGATYESTYVVAPPTVGISVSPSVVTQPTLVTLNTTITTSRPIVEVRFYQIVGGSVVYLASKFSEPFQITLAIDRSYNGTLQFYATAIDSAGYSGDSGVAPLFVSIP